MKEKTKNILKIFGIYYLISFILQLIMILLLQGGKPMSIKDLLLTLSICFGIPIVNVLFIAIAFLPTIVGLYFLFKKFKGTKTRIFLTAFLILFSNMIYYFIEYFITNNTDCHISMFIGFYAIFFLLPSLLLATLFVPKSLLPFKIEAIKTLSLMFLIGWILIVVSTISLQYIDNKIDVFKLKKYDSVIEQIEQYKKENGVYPDNFEDTVKKYRNFSYITKNNNQDFILTISNHYTKEFNYCSSDISDSCHEGWIGGNTKNYKVGRWIKSVEQD